MGECVEGRRGYCGETVVGSRGIVIWICHSDRGIGEGFKVGQGGCAEMRANAEIGLNKVIG